MSSIPVSRKCVIAQMEDYHEEIIPSLVHSLNAAGFVPDVYVNKNCLQLRGEMLKLIDGIACVVNYESLEDKKEWSNLAEKIKLGNPEFIILSTYQHDRVAKWANSLSIPVIGVVHNAKMFLDSPVCHQALLNGQTKLILLASHVAAFLNQKLPIEYVDRTAVIEAVYWGPITYQEIEKRDDSRLRVVIPGRVNLKTRAFVELEKALVANRGFAEKLRFIILGGGQRELIGQYAAAAGLTNGFELLPLSGSQQVPYAEYISALKHADLLHPLVPNSFGPYRKFKITSAIPTAIGFGLPIILDRWTERVYKTPAITSDMALAASLDVLCQMDIESLNRHKKEMHRHREMVIQRNNAEMYRILNK